MPNSAASNPFLFRPLIIPCAAFALLFAPACLNAQATQLDATNSVASAQPAPLATPSPDTLLPDTPSPAPSAASSLPDAPSSSSSQPTDAISFAAPAAPAGAIPPAGRYDKYIAPGQLAPKLTAHDKFILGIKDAISPFSAVGWFISAGYEQVAGNSPNYYAGGNDGKAFGERLGAAALRDTTEGIFSDSILAPILHEDPRYYRVGNRKNFIYRLFYAGTRPIFTRTDGGRSTINFAQLGGNFGGSVLTRAYYPSPINTGFNEVMKTFGGSVGGSALGDVVSEFLTGAFAAIHLGSAPQ